ncbi:MAG TPA: hypothetical protein VHN82_03210 [Methanoregula sp.]|nr:hypothetical protein [Methanoregula sp.]
MHGFERLSGKISDLKSIDRTSGSVFRGDLSFGNQQWMTFHVNDRPCRYQGTPDISNGDRVTVVGDGTGELDIIALRNDTTGLLYTTCEDEALLVLVVTGGCVLMGLSIPLILGFMMGSFRWTGIFYSLPWLLFWTWIAWHCYLPLQKRNRAIRQLSSG